MYYTTTYSSPVGLLTLACDDNHLIGLWLEGQKYFGNHILEKAIVKNNLDIFYLTKKWLDGYFNQEEPSIQELPLSPIGSDFRQEVWKILCEIPYGQVITYGEIAKKIALKMHKKSMSAQAVGNAVGHNPISIIIPCHRVIGTNKSLTGYAGGIDKKIKLLRLEGINTQELIIPQKGTAL
ncbi:MAG: methylated-DNA--[protein]-cysteine S-methyltransferase [Coprobacillus sp.]|nr:methylated-DNA--[protein]-cysteine S-methyltransferase [Coprobacillus sp.]